MIEASPKPASGPLANQVSAAVATHLTDQVDRLGWGGEQVTAHQRERLRALLAHAVAHSPFHAGRLAGIDADRFELADLPTLPTMTKTQMMDNLDEVLTDRGLTRSRVEEHLAKSMRVPSLLLGRYVCLASGGSSGLRGLFVQTLDEYAQLAASVVRGPMARIVAAGGPPPEGVKIGQVAAGSPIHASGFAAATAIGFPVRLVSAPATLPLAEIVERLNTAQPPVLQGYPALLRTLADERRAGRLRIAPRSVSSVSEMLSGEDRAAITDGFGVPVADVFASTEGLVGRSEPGEAVLSFASDMCIVELVDSDNQPVEDGVASAKALITNLYNLTQPLIRYELTDQFIRHAAMPGNGYLRATVAGRADSVFKYGSVELHPHAIRSVMSRESTLREYQIRQTKRGLDASIVSAAGLDTDTLAARLNDALRTAGLTEPQVTIRLVDTIERHPETGKLTRFVPLVT